MKKFMVFFLIIVSYYQVSETASAFAVDQNSELLLLSQLKDTKESQPLSKQLEMVDLIVGETDQFKILVLGAYPSQSDQFNFEQYLDPLVFYVDRLILTDKTEDLTSPFFIKSDVTDMHFLNEMVGRFEQMFDLITVDWAVTNHFHWNIEHIDAFVKLLKKGGKFIFDYTPSMFEYIQYDEDLCIKTVTHYSAELQAPLTRSTKVSKRVSYKIMPNPKNISPDLYQRYAEAVSSNYKQSMLVHHSRFCTEDENASINAIYLQYLSELIKPCIKDIEIECITGIIPYWQSSASDPSRFSCIMEQQKRNGTPYICITKK
ncbi:MAG: hypothetical protein C0432_04320 [Candidatus Puniceispirillum sp.]|nr:hypothetical protein [Candidatus Pelagibacter sp.]MBA4283501.1 hypothetical protein [Candidatus Puniceispirillum sp.]